MNKKELLKEVKSWLLILGSALIISLVAVNFIGCRTWVHGSSMETSLSDGDNLIMDKISYTFTEPKRYDIVVFPYEYQEDTNYVKRIIGLPGETIQIISGEVYINNEKLDSDIYGNEPIDKPGIAEFPITLDSDEYFVLGDNRNNSFDSRYEQVGILTKDDFVGKAWIRIYPFDTFGAID